MTRSHLRGTRGKTAQLKIQNSDDEMTEDGDSEEEDKGEGDDQLSDNGDEQEEEEEAAEVAVVL